MLATGCATAFSGDGTLRDLGRTTAEGRYQVRLAPAISLDRDGAYRFSFSGLPREEMVVGFKPTRPATLAQVREKAATIVAELVEERGGAATPLCRFEVDTATVKVTVSRADDATWLWTEQCRAIRATPDARYLLSVTVSAARDSPPMDVVASFEGGGWK